MNVYAKRLFLIVTALGFSFEMMILDEWRGGFSIMLLISKFHLGPSMYMF
ncbi:hypothetical protein HanRHA438_Chr01g0030861 [Helianthus annuus]|nr:hypothetical protein HanRHA438_Chr01g0030861 [Helianthus annuus]